MHHHLSVGAGEDRRKVASQRQAPNAAVQDCRRNTEGGSGMQPLAKDACGD
jgi:hypothetical protein